MQNKMHTWLARAISALSLITLMSANVAHAAILFQDDTFHDIDSEAILIDSNGTGTEDTSIQFGNDAVPANNGTLTWDITLDEFQFDNTVDITGDLDVSGNADFTDATQFHLREVANEATATCTTIDELVLDTTENRIYVCTATGAPGTWQGSDSGSADDFESVYSNDGDNTLTTGGTDFTISPGAGDFIVTGTGAIDFDPGSFDVDTTGAVSLDADAASNVTVDGAGLTLETTTSGDVDVSGADDVNVTGGTNVDLTSTAGDVTLTSGDDIIFDDAQLTAPIQLTDAATAIAATYGTTGIIDALNTLSATTAGDGASNVGTEAGSFTNITPGSDDVQSVLEALDAEIGSGAPNNEILTFYPEYPDAVIYPDGTANRGRLDAEYDGSEHYYRWTSRRAAIQDMDIRFRFALPADFDDVNDFTFAYRTGTAVVGDNHVDVTVNNDTDAATCGTSTNNVNAGAWTTGTITEATLEAGCAALDPGDIIEVVVKFFDNSGAADYADIGYLILGYDN